MRANFSDGLNFIGKQSPQRWLNMMRVYSSFQTTKISGHLTHWGMPLSISVEPTTACNLRCPECPSGLRAFTRPTGMMNMDLFQSIVHQLAPTLSYLIFYFQGEPYLNPRLLEMIRMASREKIYTATSTNAHYLTDEAAKATVQSGLDRLIISLDGTTQETYQGYRIGGNLEKVIEGTKNVLKWKRTLKSMTPHVIFQFLVVRHNEHQIDEVKKLGRDLGVDDVKFKTAQINDFEHGAELIPLTDKYSRYKSNGDGTYATKNSLLDECWKMWHSSVITWDGKVVPCCFDKDAHFVLGDLNKYTFKEIWEGKQYQHFRESLFSSRSTIEMCRNCSEGGRVFA